MHHVSCNLCGSQDAKKVFDSTVNGQHDIRLARYRCTSTAYGTHPPIVRCQQCGLVYTSPRQDGAAIMAAYEQVADPLYEAERNGRLITFRKRLPSLRRWAPVAGERLHVLDVGCYTGTFLDVGHEAGWAVFGVEPSYWAVEVARRRGFPVHRGTLHDAPFPNNAFDVVTLWDVVEHLLDPKATMVEIARVLRPGGLLCIHTINIESLTARLFNRHWPWLMEMHLYYFSPHTLTQMLRETGFVVQCLTSQGRTLRVGYLLSRAKAFFPRLARELQTRVLPRTIQDIFLPVNLGDLFTCYATKCRLPKAPRPGHSTPPG